VTKYYDNIDLIECHRWRGKQWCYLLDVNNNTKRIDNIFIGIYSESAHLLDFVKWFPSNIKLRFSKPVKCFVNEEDNEINCIPSSFKSLIPKKVKSLKKRFHEEVGLE